MGFPFTKQCFAAISHVLAPCWAESLFTSRGGKLEMLTSCIAQVHDSFSYIFNVGIWHCRAKQGIFWTRQISFNNRNRVKILSFKWAIMRTFAFWLPLVHHQWCRNQGCRINGCCGWMWLNLFHTSKDISSVDEAESLKRWLRVWDLILITIAPYMEMVTHK